MDTEHKLDMNTRVLISGSSKREQLLSERKQMKHPMSDNFKMSIRQSPRREYSNQRRYRHVSLNQMVHILMMTMFVLIQTAFHTVSGQTVGVDICACQPATYEFIFNFGLTCDDSNVEGEGIQATACVLNTENDQNVTNFRPSIVTRILILELDQDLEVIAQTPIVGEYQDGDIFRYTSVIASQDVSTLEPSQIPKGIQLSMAGRNSDEQDLVNFWLILFDNNCGIYPVVLEGQNIGWTILGGLTPPPNFLCPIAAQPTPFPTTPRPTTPQPTTPQPTTPRPTIPENVTEAPETEAPQTVPPTAAPPITTTAPTQPPGTEPPTLCPPITPPEIKGMPPSSYYSPGSSKGKGGYYSHSSSSSTSSKGKGGYYTHSSSSASSGKGKGGYYDKSYSSSVASSKGKGRYYNYSSHSGSSSSSSKLSSASKGMHDTYYSGSSSTSSKMSEGSPYKPKSSSHHSSPDYSGSNSTNGYSYSSSTKYSNKEQIVPDSYKKVPPKHTSEDEEDIYSSSASYPKKGHSSTTFVGGKGSEYITKGKGGSSSTKGASTKTNEGSGSMQYLKRKKEHPPTNGSNDFPMEKVTRKPTPHSTLRPKIPEGCPEPPIVHPTSKLSKGSSSSSSSSSSSKYSGAKDSKGSSKVMSSSSSSSSSSKSSKSSKSAYGKGPKSHSRSTSSSSSKYYSSSSSGKGGGKSYGSSKSKADNVFDWGMIFQPSSKDSNSGKGSHISQVYKSGSLKSSSNGSSKGKSSGSTKGSAPSGGSKSSAYDSGSSSSGSAKSPKSVKTNYSSSSSGSRSGKTYKGSSSSVSSYDSPHGAGPKATNPLYTQNAPTQGYRLKGWNWGR